MWIKISKDELIPEWLKTNLRASCPFCGSEMEHYYNGNRCTNRRCSNPRCPSFMAYKADFIAGITGYKGVGPAKFLESQMAFKYKVPLELYSSLCGKPTVDIATFLRMCCIEGIDSGWEKICLDYNIDNLDELYEKYDGKWKEKLIELKDDIYYAYQFIEHKKEDESLRKKDNCRVFTIMITGTPNNFNSKEEFVDLINTMASGYVKIVHQKTARQSGVSFLIREPGSTTRGKVTAAEKGGIPIVTSEEFMNIVAYEVLMARKEEVCED